MEGAKFLTSIVTVSGTDESCALLTTSSNLSIAALAGAVKLGENVAAFCSVTVGPAVWRHAAFGTVPSRLAPNPESCTVELRGTTWLAPASANGASTPGSTGAGNRDRVFVRDQLTVRDGECELEYRGRGWRGE